MTRETLERALRQTPLPGEGAARERVRRTVLAAHAEAMPRRRRRTAALVWVAVVACAAAVVATQRDSGPARAFERMFQRVVAEPEKAAPHASGLELPARGRMLVSDHTGLWVVERSGHRHWTGPWRDATWSPGGLFVAVAGGDTLAAVEPDDGLVRWSLERAGGVSLPRWAPDGTHIAYRAGTELHVVYGNGLHDVVAGRRMAPVAPAWRPSQPHTVAWAATDGTVTVEDADTAKVLWERRREAVRWLAWSGDGRRLLIAGRHGGAVYDLAAGRRERLAVGGELVAAAFGDRLALAVRDGAQTEVRVDGETALRGPGRVRDLEWSPDGRWLLASWAGADHWLLVPAGRGAVTAVRHRFGSGGRVLGWTG